MDSGALESERLILRQWKEEDYAIFEEMGADPEVMCFFPATLSKEESRALADRIRGKIEERGWGLWAVELKKNGAFIGFVGLTDANPKLDFSPCVEVGWRLAKAYWGNGYASEAARAALAYGFGILKLDMIYSFTACINEPSRAVMERIGMNYLERDFEHPAVAEGHPVRPHVLYGLSRAEWRGTDR